MEDAIYYKALQKKYNYRAPDLFKLSDKLPFSLDELTSAEKYLNTLVRKNIKYTYYGHQDYPEMFYSMKDSPLFLEYLGSPVWQTHEFLSVIGARNIHGLTSQWMDKELKVFLEKNHNIGLVSGGAIGVDQKAHQVSLRSRRPTVVVMPTGLNEFYPKSLIAIKEDVIQGGGCFLSEFEMNQTIRRQNFYFRNRLIAALGKISLIAQCRVKSGTYLTVHHALENGRPILTVPCHPELIDFSGNIRLIKDGAEVIFDATDLDLIWKSESWFSPKIELNPSL